MRTVTQESFGRLVWRFRRAAGLTQEELAERAGISARAVSDIERGVKHRPRPDTVQLLLEALEVPSEEQDAFRTAARRFGPAPEVPDPSSIQLPIAPTNLPDEATPFIGREREIGGVVELVQQPKVRLVTLTGTGGTGKTRLALQVAARLLYLFPDGVFVVSLASLSDPQFVPSSIAETLGVKEHGSRGLLESLSGYLHSRNLLLVLDNFEHLPDAASLVADLLDACPNLHILVTSRAVLHLSREHIFQVPPLAVPGPHPFPDSETLGRYDAVALFTERARAAQSGFTMTETNAPVVAAICDRLDGLPLAIELAAARVRIFPPQTLLLRLSSRLTLLTGGARDRPVRQQTLRDTLDWSYRLLDEDEQALFARLSVFAGGCRPESAEAVCSAERDPALTVIERMASLVDKSLLRQEGEAESRFVMLETVREYATERLAESGTEETLRRRHATYYLDLAEAAAPELYGPGQVAWLGRLQEEQGNLRAALHWARQRGEVEIGLRLAASLRQFWLVRGHRSEGEQWLEGLLAMEENVSEGRAPCARAKALQALGVLSEARTLAIARLEESLALSRALADSPTMAEALVSLASATFDQGHIEQAIELSEEGLALGRELDDKRLIALSLNNLALVAYAQNDFVRQQDLHMESLRLHRELGNKAGMSEPLAYLAWRAFDRGEYDRAATLFEERQALCRELGDRRGLTETLHGLGHVARERGDHSRAQLLYEEGLTIARQADDTEAMALAQLGLGDLARDRGEPERVDVLCAESLATFQRLGDKLDASYSLHNLGLAAFQRGDYSQAAALCEESLDILRETGFEGAMAEVLTSLGLVRHEQGDYAGAEALFVESLRLLPTGNRGRYTATALEGMAGAARARGQVERAVRLFGAAAALRTRIGSPIWPATVPAYERHMEAARTTMGDERFARAWEEGRAMTMERAVEYALDE